MIEADAAGVPMLVRDIPAGVTVENQPLSLCFDTGDFALAGALATFLRSRGTYFSAGAGWSPVEAVVNLRDSGHWTGSIPEVFWTGPGQWHTRSTLR